MPRKTNTDGWVANFRAQLRTLGPDLTVGDHRGKMRLQLRLLDGTRQRVALPYSWSDSPVERRNAMQRIEAIWEELRSPAAPSLAEANAIVQARTTGPRVAGLDWPGAAKAWHHHKVTLMGSCTERNWQLKHQRIVDAGVELMTSKAKPAGVDELIEAVAAQWEPGSRARQIAVQNLSGFLTFAVDRRRFPVTWRPKPAKAYLGASKGRSKRVGYPLADAQILRLLEGLPATAAGQRWRFGLQLMAVYGLRPEELRHLGFKGDQLWCNYMKKGGGGETKPRPLHPLPVVDVDGTATDWNVAGRLRIGEELPPIGSTGGGDAVGCYLKRTTIWQALRAEVAAAGETLTPYSLRHRYAAEGHRLGVADHLLAELMGHSLESHHRAYSQHQNQASAVQQALARAAEVREALAKQLITEHH
jgi:integrase